MISRSIAFLALALLLANCCSLGNGCEPAAPAAPAAAAPIAWDGLGTSPMDGTEATEPQARKPARAKREIIVGPLEAAGTGSNSKADSWEEQQAADQDDEARLKRKLMICQNCR